MNTRQLSYILSIAEHGNLSQAAAALNVSQPALSKYLAELESDLDTELFLRHKKQLIPTAAGNIYIDAARRIIDVKEQTYQTIASLSGQTQKTITIGVTPLRGAISISRIFPYFHKRYPHVTIQFQEHYPRELYQATVNHSVDFALRTCLELEDDNVFHITSHEEDLVLFVPAFHPLAHLASPDLERLSRIEIERFLDTPFLIGEKGSTIRELFDIIMRQLKARPTIVYESDNNLILKNIAQNGAGVSLLPRAHIEPSKNLVYFLLKPNYSMHMSVMTAKDHVLSEEERYLIALNFGAQFSEKFYRFSPSPLAKEIMDEFHITEHSYRQILNLS
ncbi:MAG: LysR family transcriptional regulator [Clostridiales bacterium]|nr:LysR family transcriptional regulator [Clostridiales bacterium]